MRGASLLLLCVVTTSPHISKPDQHVSVLENTFARMCRRMPGGCGGKMARQARQRLKAARAQQNKSVHLASLPPSPMMHQYREFPTWGAYFSWRDAQVGWQHVSPCVRHTTKTCQCLPALIIIGAQGRDDRCSLQAPRIGTVLRPYGRIPFLGGERTVCGHAS